MTLHFTATIQIIGVNPYVRVTKEQAAKLKLNWKKAMPVLVQVNGKPDTPWKINMMPMGDGDFYLYLHGEVRRASKTKVGDEVHIALQFDDTYKNGPQHEMPSSFTTALENNQKAKENWEKLIPSRQKEILRYFANLKSQEALARNISRALSVLSGKEERFMGRSWKDGV